MSATRETRERSAHVRVVKAFECRRVAGDRRAAPAQIVVYPAGWAGRMPAHHIAAGEAQNAIERLG